MEKLAGMSEARGKVTELRGQRNENPEIAGCDGLDGSFGGLLRRPGTKNCRDGRVRIELS